MPRRLIVTATVRPAQGEELTSRSFKRIIGAIGAPGVSIINMEFPDTGNTPSQDVRHVRLDMMTVDTDDDAARSSVFEALSNAGKSGVGSVSAMSANVVSESVSSNHIGHDVGVVISLRLNSPASNNPDRFVATYTKRMFDDVENAVITNEFFTVEKAYKSYIVVDVNLSVRVLDTDKDSAINKVIDTARNFPWNGITRLSVAHKSTHMIYKNK